MIVRLTQIDGTLPNVALMKLARFHRNAGDAVHFSRSVHRDMFEPAYDRVYGSAIFSYSAGRVATLRREFPGAVVGGTWNLGEPITVEEYLGIPDSEMADYQDYPSFDGSIGFTARGCRFKCKFCCVPGKEGPPKPVQSIGDIWRGTDYPKHLHLLDNDFFGQPRDAWEARLDEIRVGGFKACFNQGINIRMIDDTTAAAIASVPYYDDQFKKRRLYTAWDNVGHETKFFKGIDTLEKHGVPAHRIMAYMLVGFDPNETWERVMYRLNKMTARGIKPYPMPFNVDKAKKLPLGGHNGRIESRTLGEFQRWVVGKFYQFVPFEEYDAAMRGRLDGRQGDFGIGDAA